MKLPVKSLGQGVRTNFAFVVVVGQDLIRVWRGNITFFVLQGLIHVWRGNAASFLADIN